MHLRLVREPSWNGATLGVLFAGGHFQCFTLEDPIREIPGRPVSEWKIAGRTAIPAGHYRIVITESARFRRRLPLVADVPGFSGVRIHVGNTAADTEGCILVGADRADGRIYPSRPAFDSLFEALEQAIAAKQSICLTVENPPALRSCAA